MKRTSMRSHVRELCKLPVPRVLLIPAIAESLEGLGAHVAFAAIDNERGQLTDYFAQPSVPRRMRERVLEQMRQLRWRPYNSSGAERRSARREPSLLYEDGAAAMVAGIWLSEAKLGCALLWRAAPHVFTRREHERFSAIAQYF